MRSFSAILVMATLLLAGCSSVRRIDTDTVTDLSGNWNDTDSRLVAEEMISDCLSRPWLSNYNAAHAGKQPTVIVGSIANQSDEHIATDTFVQDIQRELTNSNKVTFVAGREERNEVRAEREDQQLNSSPDTMKKMRNETGADYMLKGSISTITDQKGGETARYYQVDMQLIDMETNAKVWIGTKKIKKLIYRSGWGG